MGLRTQDFSELGFVNDFMFAKVMRNGKLCKQLLEVILGVTIERIDYLEEQKTIDHSMDARGVRLDVYVKDDKHTVYNVEMQTTITNSIRVTLFLSVQKIFLEKAGMFTHLRICAFRTLQFI